MLFKRKNKGYLNCKIKTMRTSFFIIALLLSFSTSSKAQNDETVTLTIEMDVTKYNKGTIYLALYNSKENYMKKSYKDDSKKVSNHKVRLVFEGVKKGDYAFSVFHDVNNNKKMDKNFFGIPKEPYAFSNNQKGRFGPPKFEKAKFNVTKDLTVNISIK